MEPRRLHRHETGKVRYAFRTASPDHFLVFTEVFVVQVNFNLVSLRNAAPSITFNSL